jgi:hypothetical protein
MEKWIDGLTMDFKTTLERNLNLVHRDGLYAFLMDLDHPEVILLVQALASRTHTFSTLLHQNLENTLRDFILLGFSMEAAWILAKTLTAVILTMLATAHAGSKNPPLNDNLGLATKMLWGVLQTHFAMEEFNRQPKDARSPSSHGRDWMFASC